MSIKKLLSALENPDHPLLGPTLKGLNLWGLCQSAGWTSVAYNIIHISAILFVISQYIELWYIRSDLPSALRNLSVSMLSTVCVVKASTFVYWQHDWRDIMNFVSALEIYQISKNDKAVNSIIKKYTQYSRRITYVYWFLVISTVLTLILAPLISILSSPEDRVKIKNNTKSYPEIMSSWAPFDKSRGPGYIVITIEHVLICFYGGGIVANYDTNAFVLMSFIAGQMKIIRQNCERLFEGRDTSHDVILRRIACCYHHHISLVKFAKVFNDLLSPVMFLYVVICSLMICASAIQLTMKNTTNMQKIWISEYLMSLITQLFMYCWHSNEVLDMSKKVDQGIYKSDWWSSNLRMRRNILLLGGQLRKTVIFTAGPFAVLSLSTFIAILKGSYSYYTILSEKAD
ncbi:odorant receptor Or2-like [Achroia grisella]|uniref:odorant receptor Or2-like n=1 Tax=Achroia grisella TaxID=688607 RepID=UPI0027D30962|nr:odorant receptor Or2-like [Achroia grisella]